MNHLFGTTAYTGSQMGYDQARPGSDSTAPATIDRHVRGDIDAARLASAA